MKDFEKYDAFVKKLESEHPLMFAEKRYGGVCVEEGWWPIIYELCQSIQSYITWNNEQRASLLKNNPFDRPIPDKVEQVVVDQIKEKFGGLRFYYCGGDKKVEGMVSMAESWAANTCETCGAPATKQTKGWVKTVCDKHYDEIMEKRNESRNQ